MAQRTCEQCHRRMSPFVPRKKNEAGKYVCEGCANDREGRPLSSHAEVEPVVIRSQAHLGKDAGGRLIVLAHGNMDGVTVYHCPFCGSGQVVNNGTSIECGFCHTNFSVLVQPNFPMMPQTINGEPYAPGQKPNDGTVPTGQPQQAPPQAPGDDKGDKDDDTSFGGDDLSEKPTKDGGDDGDSGGDKPNPFAKKDDDSGSDDSPPPKESMLITASGVALPLDEYMAHLALSVTPDKDQTLAEVKRQHHKEV